MNPRAKGRPFIALLSILGAVYSRNSVADTAELITKHDAGWRHEFRSDLERIDQYGDCACQVVVIDPITNVPAMWADLEADRLLCTETASESLNLQFCSVVVNYDIPWNPMTLEQRAGRIDRIGQERPVVDVVNLFYEGTAEHDAYEAVARCFENIRANVGEYPPIIAAGIQRIIRDEADPDAELERLTARNEFDINRLNVDWEAPNAPINPRVTIDDLEKALRQPELMPPGWSVKSAGGKHWDVTDPADRTDRVTTDAEAYQRADGRLRWWQGPSHEWT